MRVLFAGYNALQREKQDEQNGVKPEHRSRLSDFNDRLQSDDDTLAPHRRDPSEPAR